jgi:tetratricopeptide (TPR) repeat protein
MRCAPCGTSLLWQAAALLSLAALAAPVAASADQKSPAAVPAAFDQVSKAATEARTQNRVEDAIGLYRQAVNLNPSWAEGWWFLGELLYDQNQYPEARDALRRLIDVDRTTGPGFALLGLCEFETKEYGKALNHIYQARRLGLGDDQQVRRVVLFHEMLLLTWQKQYEAALQVLVSVVKNGGAGPAVIEAAGIAALRRPIFPEELKPGDKDLIERAGRAVCAVAAKDAAGVEKYFAELLAAYPKSPNVHYLYGSFLSATDKDAELREYQKELELNPKHTQALASIALEYEARGDLDTAISYARRAVEADPQFFGAHAVLGKLLASAGQAEQAIKELEIARDQASDSPQVHFSLATAYAMVGRKADAAHERAEFARLKKLTDEISQ